MESGISGDAGGAGELISTLSLLSVQCGRKLIELYRMPIGHLIVLAESVEQSAMLQQMAMAAAISACFSKEGQQAMREKADRLFGQEEDDNE